MSTSFWKTIATKPVIFNEPKHCQIQAYNAQWNDDIHHALHVLITGEQDGYYSDYSERPLDQLGRCLVEGFAYQGEASLFRNGQARGERTAGLPPSAFVSFLQNHDQIGNRAFGERIATIADSRGRSGSHGDSSACSIPTFALHGRRVRGRNAISLFL